MHMHARVVSCDFQREHQPQPRYPRRGPPGRDHNLRPRDTATVQPPPRRTRPAVGSAP
ncbi:hypothetical protein NSERUTF1_2195 [Nocardia seriolae]|nr:hypothetical protein NSERUTF1_2195 [Nocardia seriolae]